MIRGANPQSLIGSRNLGDLASDGDRPARGHRPPLQDLLIGTTNGSMGETAGLLILVCGLYLAFRRMLDWRIPLAIMVGGSAGVFERYAAILEGISASVHATMPRLDEIRLRQR